LLVGFSADDQPEDIQRMAQKVFHLRVFEDDDGKMNLSLTDVGGEILLVPQFTLYGETRRGRRPSWIRAAPPDVAEAWVESFAAALASLGARLSTGVFQQHMEVELVNDGPVTLMLDSADF
jgi:D-tyrosyl-tRNA(Tyr) deacylase